MLWHTGNKPQVKGTFNVVHFTSFQVHYTALKRGGGECFFGHVSSQTANMCTKRCEQCTVHSLMGRENRALITAQCVQITPPAQLCLIQAEYVLL